LGIFKIRSHKLFAGAASKHDSPDLCLLNTRVAGRSHQRLALLHFSYVEYNEFFFF
jgi:hypothetical protein